MMAFGVADDKKEAQELYEEQEADTSLSPDDLYSRDVVLFSSSDKRVQANALLDTQGDFNCISMKTFRRLGLTGRDIKPSRVGRYDSLSGTGETHGRVKLEWRLRDDGTTSEDDFEVVDTDVFDLAIGKTVCHREQLLVRGKKNARYFTLVSKALRKKDQSEVKRLAEQNKTEAALKLIQKSLEKKDAPQASGSRS